MAGESYTTKKILLKAVDGTTTQYFIPYVNNATADKTGLVKPDGTTITVDANGVISAQVDTSGLQPKIDADHKLSADLISDGTTNKVVTATEKSTWNGKQNAISDLSTIRSNAEAGAGAASTIAGYGNIVTHDADEFLTEHQDISGKQDKIDSSHKLSADLISDGTTNKTVTATEKSTWSGKQDAIADLSTIRSNAESGAGAAATIAEYGDVVSHDADEFAGASHTHTKSQITDFPTIPTVNDAEIEIQKNGTKVASFTTNQGGSKKTINITVPTSAADVSALPASTKYGSAIDLAIDSTTYVVTATLKDQDGTALSTDTIDLPLESVVVSGSYDSTNKKVVLTLQSGSTIEFSVADLISGLQSEITSSNKLSADLISDGTTNKTVTATEKSTWNGKQNAIADLSTIRSNAESGAGAASTIAGYGDIVTHDADEFAEATHSHAISDVTNLQTTLNGKQATIDSSHKLSADLISDGTTNKTVTATEKSTWNGKQNAISDLSTIRSNAEAGASAASTIAGYGDIVTHDANEFLTEHQDISGKANTADLGAAAFSNSYNDLDNKPTIPTVNNATLTIQKNGTTVKTFTANASSNVTCNITVPTQPSDVGAAAASHTHVGSEVTLTGYEKASTASAIAATDSVNEALGKVEKALDGKQAAGSYAASSHTHTKSEITDFPTIPTVNNKTITIQKNGTKVDDFTLNQSSNKTINITVPTQPSDIGAAASSHTHVGTETVLTGYEKAASASAVAATDTVNAAIGKIEKALDGKQASGSYAAANHTHTYSDVGAAAASHSHVGTEVTLTGYTKASSASAIASTDSVNAALGKLEKALDGKQGSGSYAPTSHTHTSGDISALTGYTKASAAAEIAATDSLNTALGKIQKSLDGKQASGSYAAADHTHSNYVPTSRTVNSKALTSNITLSASDVGAAASSHSHVGTETVLTGYSKPSSTSAVAATDTVNAAIGKLEKAIDGKQASGSYAAASHTHTKSEITDFPTIPTITDTYSGTSSDGMSGKAVKSAIDSAVASVYKPAGSIAFASRPTPGSSYKGNVYNITDSFTTDSTFVEGAGNTYPAGTNIVCINTTGSTYKWDVLAGFVDLSGYATTSHTHTPASIGAAAASHTHVGTETVLTGYSKASSASAVAATDTVNAAIGKLEKAIDGKQASGSYAAADHTHDTFVGSGSSAAAGMVPKPSTTAGTTKYLREDGSWEVPDGTYTHPTTSGNKHIPSGGSSGKILKWASDGTASWETEYSYTHPSTAGNKHVPSGGSSNQVLVYGGSSGTASWGAVPSHTHDYAASNHTHDTFVKSGTGAAAGMVPAPSTTAGTTKYLCEDGTWATPAGTYSHPTGAGYNHIPTGGSTGQILKYSASGTATWANEYSYTHPTTAGNKHIPTGGSAGQVLGYGGSSGTATWTTPTTYSDFVGSGTSAAAGLVPKPSTTAGTSKYLCEDGSWATPPDTVYTHPTTSGNKHIPSGGSSGKILKWSSDGTASWETEYSYTHPTTAGNKHVPSGGSSNQVLIYGGSSGTASWGAVPSHTHSGYQSTDTAVTHTASTAVGDANTPVYIASDGTATALSYTIAKSVPSDAVFTDTVYTHPTTAGNKHIPSGGSSNQVLVYSAAGTAAWGSVPTHTHSGYQSTDTAVTHTASTAVGGTTTPVYIASDGKATALSYTIAKSVPSDAVFTDTVYTHPTTSGNKHIPSGGSSGKILKWSSDGTATWETEYSYTHPTTAGNKHIPSGGSSNQILVYSASGTAVWGSVPSHNQASSTINAMTSYSKASAAAAIAATDSLNTAVGKLEYKVDDVDTQLQALTAILNAEIPSS